ncbi:aldolase/citrate lyase family protein [Acrocarpospora macrocephala]|uniref:Aldolase n=1 Tax=Acrocarpospora macrocephala TaxID=150177 RepID=A0A5M3WZ24_9ACTN|nr:aldolase [Acrocarpospora macrocephala]GES11683.1 aldolase [Acrocarpospora macrocephala]
METTLGPVEIAGFAETHGEQHARYPTASLPWQPVHTVYVPADRLTSTTPADWGRAATELLDRHLPTPEAFAAVFDHDGLPRVAAKLATEPIEDLRVDFEDGYGVRPDEDADTERAAVAIAAMHAAGSLPRRWGLRVKSFADGDPARAIRTLDGFLTGVIRNIGQLPAGFTVTLPKVLMSAYLGQFATYLDELEDGLGLPYQTLGFEMQVEAPQTVLFLSEATRASGGRLRAAHFGVFDYTAACGLPPHEQRLDHPACDHARNVMQTTLLPEGIELSDGSLAASPASDSRDDVLALWRRHAQLVRHSLGNGFYQGWDMHPSHLVSRYATTYAFHLRHYDEYQSRVRAWHEQRQEGGVMDEPATVKTMTAALTRAHHCLGIE